jgi:predicted enzyme related to lactoylglutathione lyase
MAYTDRSFCWHGIVSPDTAAVRRFHTEALGWSARDVPMGPDATAVLIPAHWESYLRVEDVDAATADKVRASSGPVLGDRMEAPGVGAMYVAADPTGGVFGIIEPARA